MRSPPPLLYRPSTYAAQQPKTADRRGRQQRQPGAFDSPLRRCHLSCTSAQGEDVNQIDLSQSARNFGYPTCFTVHSPSAFPSPRTVGSQFSIDASVSDADCDANSAAARLALCDLLFLSHLVPTETAHRPAHYAPLDIRFLTSANTSFGTSWVNSALVASHGSWNADPPVGYSLLRVPFDSSTNEPIATVDNPQGYETIFAPPDISACPGGCFRPVGIAVERARAGDNGVFVTSDSTGEIVRVYRGSALPVRSGASKDAAAMILLVGGLAVHLLA